MDKEFYQRALAAQREGEWQLAFQIVQEGAFRGLGMCMWWLGMCYDKGFWVGNQSKSEAIQWFKKAVNAGNTRAMTWFIIRQFSVPDVNANDLRIWRKAIMEGDDDYAKAMIDNEYVKKISKNADCFFKYFAASQYEYGASDLAQNINKAKQLYEEASNEGCVCSNVRLGYAYSSKFSVVGGICDVNRAIFHYRKAAEQKSGGAMFRLALLHADQKNYAASRYWFYKSPMNIDANARGNFILKYLSRFRQIEHCQNGCMTLLTIRWFRPSILSILPKDVVRMIAKRIWQMRDTYDDDKEKTRKKSSNKRIKK